MCGIGGVIGVAGNVPAMCQKLLVALAHRGPDDTGIEQVHPRSMLVHARLAILDTSMRGHQPMRDFPCDQSPPNWVVSNGEIFNFRELQGKLARADLPCQTQCDTEVILQGYRLWGEECVQHFRGMFAFCLVDMRRAVAHLYRDRLGIKPLYIYRPPQGGLIFASEVRAILALGVEVIAPRVNRHALESFLAQGAVYGEDSFIEGIKILPPGTQLTIELETGREVRRRTYWQLPRCAASEIEIDRRTTIERLSALGREAVQLRLISDVPFGLFLSAGIDSTAMLALASETSRAEPVRTISVGFDVADFDESSAAAVVAREFASRHETYRLTEQEMINSLPSILRAMDQPTVDGANTYIVSQVARRAGLTVALSGLGGDELFGGYASFTDVPRALRLRRRLFGGGSLGRLGRAFARTRTALKLTELLTRPAEPLAIYLLRRELFLPTERRLLQPELPPDTDSASGLKKELLADLRCRSRNFDIYNQISFFEIESYMRHMLLRDADAFSMAVPIEYRVPFLDHKFVEAVFSLPGKWKRPDPRPKPLLLDIIGDRLPKLVWQKPKRGFAFPWGEWFRRGRELTRIVNEAIHDVETWKRLDLNPRGVAEIGRRFVQGDARVSPLQILAFVVLRDYVARHGLQTA
jgi:asparagine synthase (glutamine-hydrolysing)